MSIRRSPVLALSLSYAGMFAPAIAVNLLPVLFSTLRTAFGGPEGLSEGELGRIPAFLFTGLVGAIIVTAPLADRIGPRLLAVAGNLLTAAGLAMVAAASRFELVLIGAAVMGLGAGVLDLVLSPLVAVIQPHRRGQAMNLLHAFYCFGAVAAVMLGALSRQWDMSWRLVCAALALVPATVGIGFTGLILPPLVSESEQRTSARELVMSKTFLAACVVMLLVGGAELAMAQWLPYYAEKSLRYSEWQGGMAFVGFLAAMAAGRVGVGLLGRVDALHLLLWSCVLSAVLYLTASYAPWPGAALGAGIAIGFGVSCLWPSVLGMAADRFPQGGATMFAFLAAFGNLGGIAMPWLVGVCADRWGLNVGLSVATLCPALAVLILGGQILRGRSAARAELSMAPAGQL